LRNRQQDDGPQDPLPGPSTDVEVDAPFMSQADARSSQRTKRGWHCEIEQQLKKIEEELRHRHRRLLPIS